MSKTRDTEKDIDGGCIHLEYSDDGIAHPTKEEYAR